MIGLFLALAAVADSPPPQMLQPTSKWTVNFDEAQCVASRNYGTPAQPLYLMLKQPPVGDVMQLAMVEGGSASAPAQYEGKLTLGATQPIEVSVLRFQPKGAKMRTYLVNLSTDQFASAVRAPNVRLQVPQFDRNIALADMAPLAKVMNDCVTDLRKAWNINSPQQERVGLDEGARGDLRKLFSADDYPIEALMNDQSGTVTVAVLIDERGKVADCSVVGTSGAAALDAQTCFIFKERARFEPAVGPEGKPRKDGYTQRITWMTLFDVPEPTRIRR